jgi:hypothetical protein
VCVLARTGGKELCAALAELESGGLCCCLGSLLVLLQLLSLVGPLRRPLPPLPPHSFLLSVLPLLLWLPLLLLLPLLFF